MKKKPKTKPHKASSVITLLALDPGTTNFAWSLIRLTGKAVSVLETGMFPKDVLREVTTDSLDDWTVVFFGLLGKLSARPDFVVWERYQTRKTGSKNNETINLGLGIVHACCVREGLIVLDPTMPATWKNAWNKAHGTNKQAPWQEIARALCSGKTTVHQRDSIGLGIHTLSKLASMPKLISP